MNGLDVGLLVLRAAVGLIFAAHGAQKAFGWWSGPGIAGWQAALDRMGFRPTPLWAALSIGAELIGGLALAVGLLTPLAAAVVIGQSTVIIVKAHWPRGFWNAKGGMEFPLSLGAGAVALALAGPGAISVDAAAGVAVADALRVVLIVIGIAGGLAATSVARPQQQAATT